MTIYHEPWWLDIVTDRSWDAVQVVDGGSCRAWMPFVRRRRRGFEMIGMPPFTSFLGPVLEPASGPAPTALRRRLSLTEALVRQLPNVSLFRQKFHADVTDVLAFQGAGFQAFVQYTFEVPPAPRDILWANMRDKTRNVIRQSESRNAVEVIDDAGAFAAAYSRHLAGAGLANDYDSLLMERLLTAAIARDCGRILGVRGGDGALEAAIVYFWDAHSAYHHLTSRNRARRDNGAISQLLWVALQDAAARGLVFDFDGLGSMGGTRFFSGFGGRLASRFGVEKTTRLYDVVRSARQLVGGRPATTFF